MASPAHTSDDPIASRLLTIAQYILVVTFGLLPIFFVPSVSAPFGYSKIVFILVGTFFATILYAFALLRGGVFRAHLSWAPIALLIVALVALVSAFISGDVRDALIGETFEVHTALFVALLAFVSLMWMLLGTNKVAIVRLFTLLAGSTILLSLFHIVRLFFGADFLPVGLFGGDPTLSPLGAWNDLAIFFGVAIILSLVALEQLRLTRAGQALFGFVTLVALIMLAVINFFAVWIVLGLISVVVLIYGLTKDRFAGHLSTVAKPALSPVSIGISLVVLIASVVFILGGGIVGEAMSRLTSINYMEVRPSLGATMSIAKHVYASEPLFGTGPNRFVDAWRLFKDPSLNESIFWNTDFMAGFGYVPTFFVTTGLLGGIAWIVFIALFLVTGLRMLLRASASDPLWYFIGTTSFTAGIYIWGMTLIYVPGPVLLIIAALCTGLLSASYGALMHTKTREVSSHGNSRVGFVLIAFFLVLVIGSVSGLYFTGKHYAAVYAFNSSAGLIASGSSIDAVEARTIEAYNLSGDDAYARRLAEYQIARLNSLLSLSSPTEEQKEQFRNALGAAVNAAQVALAGDGTDPRNPYTLGSVYATLVPGKVEGAYERSLENLQKARELDPQSPSRVLTLAQLAFAAGKTDEARKYVEEAIGMKQNYTDALFFLAQMDIAAGNTDAAIAASRSITVFEPQNPVRFFQLGVLLFSTKAFADAATVLERAVALDESYSNARFYLALAYDELHRPEDARAQLDATLALNPGNELITNLLKRLDQHLPLVETSTSQAPLREDTGVNEDEGSVTASSTPDTPLVSPVNTPGKEGRE
jgi:tetratricopeptide (TPR) repeat protein